MKRNMARITGQHIEEMKTMTVFCIFCAGISVLCAIGTTGAFIWLALR